MKRILIALLILGIATVGYTANEYKDTSTIFLDGDTTYFNDIDTELQDHVLEPLDRLLYNFKEGCGIIYATAATLTVETGEVVLHNAAGSLHKMRRNTSDVTVTWADIDTGAEASETTYYLYAIADADATTFTVQISASSSAPDSATYYRRLGSFYNNASSNVEQIANDDRDYIFASGEVANGGTIPLPTGFLAQDCDFIFVPFSGVNQDLLGMEYDFSISSRVVTATWNELDSDNAGDQSVEGQYITFCTK